jgi:hypothetical protein
MQSAQLRGSDTLARQRLGHDVVELSRFAAARTHLVSYTHSKTPSMRGFYGLVF